MTRSSPPPTAPSSSAPARVASSLTFWRRTARPSRFAHSRRAPCHVWGLLLCPWVSTDVHVRQNARRGRFGGRERWGPVRPRVNQSARWVALLLGAFRAACGTEPAENTRPRCETVGGARAGPEHPRDLTRGYNRRPHQHRHLL